MWYGLALTARMSDREDRAAPSQSDAADEAVLVGRRFGHSFANQTKILLVKCPTKLFVLRGLWMWVLFFFSKVNTRRRASP